MEKEYTFEHDPFESYFTRKKLPERQQYPELVEKSKNFTIRDSSRELLEGCEMKELDSIPMEFFDVLVNKNKK